MQTQTSPIGRFRSEHNVTLDALGQLVGVHKTTVLRWENGRVPAERVAVLERLTGIPRSALRPDLFLPENPSADPAKVSDEPSVSVSHHDAETSACPTQRRPRAALNPSQATR